LVVARKLGRRCLRFELSAEYAVQVRDRLAAAREGQPLKGADDPQVSAPSSVAG
jgi:hypothetical protein